MVQLPTRPPGDQPATVAAQSTEPVRMVSVHEDDPVKSPPKALETGAAAGGPTLCQVLPGVHQAPGVPAVSEQ